MLFSSEDKKRILSHMNEDHAASNLIYVKVWGGLPHAESAELIDIEAGHMRLKAITADTAKTINIAFDPELKIVKDAETRLVELHFKGAALLVNKTDM